MKYHVVIEFDANVPAFPGTQTKKATFLYHSEGLPSIVGMKKHAVHQLGYPNNLLVLNRFEIPEVDEPELKLNESDGTVYEEK